jgi:plasmid rolling circle replication initiator protein Rep
VKNKKKSTKSQSQSSQYDLKDFKQTGKIRHWDKRKLESFVVSSSYSLMSDLKKYGEKMASCGDFLKFGACSHVEHGKKLIKANFCKARLCGMCQWRKSLVVRKQVVDLVHEHQKKYSSDVPLLLTLTVVNVKGGELNKAIDQMNSAWKRLTELKIVKGSVRSWFRSLEVTYNKDRDDYHPHFHALLMVPHHYFYKDRGLYIPHEKWLELWKKSMRDDRITQVDIRKVKSREQGSLESLAGEVAKYATKPSSYIFENEEGEEEASPKVIEELHYALKGRRLIGFGGLFSKIRKMKKMVDVEEANLIHVDEEEVSKQCSCKICGSTLMEELYGWNIGFKRYRRIYLEEKSEEYESHKAQSDEKFFREKEGVSCERREGKKPSLLLAALKRGVEQEKDNSKEETILSCKIASFLISLRGPP